MVRNAPVVRAAFAACVVAGLTTHASAIDARFQRVLGAGAALPNGAEIDHLARPVMDHGRVLFSNGTSNSNQTGLYLYEGGTLRTIAAAGDTIPGNSGAVQRVLRHDIRDGRIVFTSFGEGFDIALSEHTAAGNVRLADRTTTRPDGDTLAFPLWTAIDSNGRVVLTDLDGGGDGGVYGVRPGEPLERIYDHRQQQPGGGPRLGRIESVGADAGTAAFYGEGTFNGGTTSGIYTVGPDGGNAIAREGQFVSGVGLISGFDTNSVSLHDGNVTFSAEIGFNPETAAFIADDDGSNLRAIATLDTVVPGHDDGMTFGDGFAQFADTSTFGGAVVIEVQGQSGTAGLYFRDDDGFLSTLVNQETLLGGRTAFSFDITGRSFDGTSVAFIALFDGADGGLEREVWIARVPTPGPAAAVLVGAVCAVSRRRR